MAKVFLDTNYFIDLIEGRRNIKVESFKGHSLYISSLSIPIYCYVYKIKIPDEKLNMLFKFFNVIELDEEILKKSLQGPTNDLEDNIQLHSAVKRDCEIFLTSDKKLLSLKYFGKMQIENNL